MMILVCAFLADGTGNPNEVHAAFESLDEQRYNATSINDTWINEDGQYSPLFTIDFLRAK